MNQLFTSTTDKKSPTLNHIQDGTEKLPDYLTKRNPSFQQMLHQALSTITTTSTVNNNNSTHLESLRQIAIFIYKMMVIQVHHALWTIYFKSGTGQLITTSQMNSPFYSTAVSIWPKQVKILSPSTNGKTINDEHEFYLKLVQNHLYELEQRLQQVQTEQNSKTRNLPNYTLTVQTIIGTYIERNLQPFRREMANQIDLVHYDYHIRSLKLEYLRHKPNAYQVCVLFCIRCVVDLCRCVSILGMHNAPNLSE